MMVKYPKWPCHVLSCYISLEICEIKPSAEIDDVYDFPLSNRTAPEHPGEITCFVLFYQQIAFKYLFLPK